MLATYTKGIGKSAEQPTKELKNQGTSIGYTHKAKPEA